MKVRITGNTDSVITFNQLGLTLQGKLVGTVEVENAAQIAEIEQLEAAGLISIEELKTCTCGDNEGCSYCPSTKVEEKDEETKEETKEEAPAPEEEVEYVPSDSIDLTNPDEAEETENKTEESPEEKTEETEEETPAPKKKRGRPKGSKDKNKRVRRTKMEREKEAIKQAEAQNDEEGSKVVISTGNGVTEGKMTKSAAQDLLDQQDELDAANKAKAEEWNKNNQSDVVENTGKGAVKGKTVNNMAGDIPDSEKTKASLKAMEQLEEEENGERTGFEEETEGFIDESELDPSEQANRPAIVSDMGKPQQIEMKNSIVEGADDIKKKDPFIDREAQETAEDDMDNIFLDE